MCSQDISMSNVSQSIGVSDHRIQIVDYKIVPTHITVPSHFVHSLNKCCWDDVRSCLSRTLWSVLNIFDDIDDIWGFFHNILQNCLDTYTPLKKIRSKYFKRPTPWLTLDILSAISAKHKAKRTAELTHDPGDVDCYKSIKNGLKTMIRAAKLHYIKSLLTRSCRSRKLKATLWSEVNEIIG